MRTNHAAYHKCAASPSKRRPSNVVDAQFSIPIMVALAAINGKVFLNDLTAENWENKFVLDLADKVEVRVDPDLDKIPHLMVPNIIELETTAGKRHVKRIDFVKGSPQDPMSFAECLGKFEACVAFAAKPIAADKIRKFVQMVQNLEAVDDIRRTAELLVG